MLQDVIPDFGTLNVDFKRFCGRLSTISVQVSNFSFLVIGTKMFVVNYTCVVVIYFLDLVDLDEK